MKLLYVTSCISFITFFNESLGRVGIKSIVNEDHLEKTNHPASTGFNVLYICELDLGCFPIPIYKDIKLPCSIFINKEAFIL